MPPVDRANVAAARCRRFGEAAAPRRGFTLIELVITVLVMGILAGVAAPKYARTLRRLRVEAACRRIKADLALARQSAISQSVTRSVQFTANSGVYTLPGLASLDRPSTAYSVDLAAKPYEARVTSASLGGDAQVQFDYFGQPDSGGVITVSSGGLTGTVTLDSTSGLASIP